MDIQEIKAKLTIAEILQHYNLKADKHQRLNCPFHEDKTPSMQVYYKTNTAYCFSSNCKTHGKSLDVIDFIMHKENLSKHEAIKKSEGMISGNPTTTSNTGTTYLNAILHSMILSRRQLHPSGNYFTPRASAEDRF